MPYKLGEIVDKTLNVLPISLNYFKNSICLFFYVLKFSRVCRLNGKFRSKNHGFSENALFWAASSHERANSGHSIHVVIAHWTSCRARAPKISSPAVSCRANLPFAQRHRFSQNPRLGRLACLIARPSECKRILVCVVRPFQLWRTAC